MSGGKFTDAQARRVAMNLAAQLPATPKDARLVVEYMAALTRFASGDAEIAEREEPG